MSTYEPPRPQFPFEKPFEHMEPPPAPDMGAPVKMPPPPPPCGTNPDIPALRPVPPVPSPIQGSSLYETVAALTGRVNMCIDQWNMIQRNNYEYLRKSLEIAKANDVYYDNHEVNYTEGYDTTEGCTYSIVRKRAVDHRNQPIYVQLVPAYKNSSNPGVTQPIFDASFVDSANMIITAVQAGSKTWEGPALWKGNPIPFTPAPSASDHEPGEPEPVNYVYGFTRRGALRYFRSNDLDTTTLLQNGMYNVVGGCLPIIYNGEVIDEVKSQTTRKAICAIGYNSGNGDVYFFSCSAQNQPGMGVASVARILQQYGCTTAIVTSQTANNNPTASEGMLYMGQMTTDPVGAIVPDNLAYWVITKKRFFRNEFQKEVADLIQTTGQNAWKIYLLGQQIQDFDDRITANTQAINEEIQRAKNAEEKLQDNIDAEVDRATEAETALDNKIEQETQRAIAAEQEITNALNDEISRAKQAENTLNKAIFDETLRATKRENEIQDALNSEITERINADNDLLNAINQEILARQAADTELRASIAKAQSELSLEIFNLSKKINEIIAGTYDLPYLKLSGGTMTGGVTFTGTNTITVGRGPTEDLEVATKKYVDDAVSTGGGSEGADVSKEYVDQQIENLQRQLGYKVSISGDAMTGNLTMSGNMIIDPVISAPNDLKVTNGADGPGKIVNIAEPTDDNDAVNKKYLDDSIDSAKEEIKDEIGDEYIKTTGGTMTGDLTMSGSATVNLNGKGHVYADGSDSVLQSSSGAVRLIGTEIKVGNNSNSPIEVSGVSAVKMAGNVKLTFGTSSIDIKAGTLNVGSSVNNGRANLGSTYYYNSSGTYIGNISIDSSGRLSVYGPGGTSFQNNKIVNLAAGTASTDAVNVGQLPEIIKQYVPKESTTSSTGSASGIGTSTVTIPVNLYNGGTGNIKVTVSTNAVINSCDIQNGDLIINLKQTPSGGTGSITLTPVSSNHCIGMANMAYQSSFLGINITRKNNCSCSIASGVSVGNIPISYSAQSQDQLFIIAGLGLYMYSV